MKIAKEGLIFIVPALALCVIFLTVSLWLPFVVLLIITFSFCYFFRDPKRSIPKNKNMLLAPADGKIVKIQTDESHPFFPSPVNVISIFLSLFDVHITRAPLTGTVREIEYKPGQFFPAYKEEASSRNESNSLFINSERLNILVKQIAGVAARRIKCFVKRNERIKRGQKMGLIYFGSRVDLFLPQDIQLRVSLNQKVKAGLTEIAEIKNGKETKV